MFSEISNKSMRHDARILTAAGRRPASIAFTARARADQSELAALRARITFITLESGDADFLLESKHLWKLSTSRQKLFRLAMDP